MAEKPWPILVHFGGRMANEIKADLLWGNAAAKFIARKHPIALLINSYDATAMGISPHHRPLRPTLQGPHNLEAPPLPRDCLQSRRRLG
ncbi:hypothetical protein E2562_021961 [Oryza meyeriana var. granulata]|uniref:Uncharacterized protein n=1 Tax=Oryza meyeriana var. granulata TaxID=110450 RepID=A0A6G1DLM8_9ORYZ|nr:hypothetical protein E2562_021961 [Oryza meyeriana var. granulata]